MLLEPRFFVEVLRLLTHLAFADGRVTEAETFAVLETARQHHLPEAEITALAAALAGHVPLPPLDLTYLREHRGHVLEIARVFTSADGLALAEKRVLEHLRELLS